MKLTRLAERLLKWQKERNHRKNLAHLGIKTREQIRLSVIRKAIH